MQNYLIDDTAKTKGLVANVADFGLEPSDIMAFWAPNLLVDPTMGRIDDGGTTRKEIIYGLAVEMDGQYMSPAIYPFDNATEDSTLNISNLEVPLITMDKTEYVTFYGLEFTGGTDLYGKRRWICTH